MWNLGFPGGWDGKESAHSEEDPGRLSSWVRKIPWRREWQPTPIFLPGESHGQRNLAGYSPSGRKEWDTTEQLTLTYMQSKTRHKWIHLQNRKRLTDTENRLWLPRGWAVWGRGMDWEFGVSGCGVFIFNWRIIASQCYIGFCCTTMWVSYKHIHIPSLWSLPPSPPSCPLGHPQSTELSFPLAIYFTHGSVNAALSIRPILETSCLCYTGYRPRVSPAGCLSKQPKVSFK